MPEINSTKFTNVATELNASSLINDAALKAYWRFEDGWTDSSGEGNTLTPAAAGAAPTFTTGKFTRASSYSYAASQYAYRTALGLNTDQMTVSAWVYPATGGSGSGRIIEQNWGGGRDGMGWCLGYSWASNVFFGSINTNTSDVSTTAINLDRWSHLAMTYDGANVRLYFNGKCVSTGAKTGNISEYADPLHVGAGHNASGVANEFFHGQIDDVAVFNRALSGEEIQRLSGMGLNGHYRFEDTLTDSSGNGNTLVATSDTKLLLHFDGADESQTFTDSSIFPLTLTAAGNAKNDTAQYKFGTASLACDGTGDYVSIPDSEDWCFGTEDFTVDMWAKRNANGVNHYLIGQADAGGTQRSWEITYTNTNGLLARWWYGSGSYLTIGNTVTMTDTNWHHIALVKSGNTIKLYFDGAASATTGDATGKTNDNSNAILAVGALGLNGSSFNGWLDEVRITKGTALWTSDFSVPTGAATAVSYTPTYSEGKFGKAVDFGTANTKNFLRVEGNFGSNGLDHNSMACWVKMNTEIASSVQFFMAKQTDTGDKYYGIYYDYNGGTRRVTFYNDTLGAGSNSVNYTLSLGTTSWHHFAYTRDGALMRCYVDGTYVGSCADYGVGTGYTTLTNVVIGAQSRYGLGGPSNFLSAKVDDAVVFNRALSSDEIKLIYEGKFFGEIEAVEERMLQGLWHLNNNVNDSSGNEYHLTGGGAPVYAAGKLGLGMDLEASSSQYLYIINASCPNLNMTSSRTMMALIKKESVPGGAEIIMGKRGTLANDGYLLYIDNNMKVNVAIDGLANIDCFSDVVLEIGKWYFVCGVYDKENSLLKVWVNNVKREEATSGTAATGTASFAIGCDYQSGGVPILFFDGVIDEAAIYSRALTNTEVLDKFNKMMTTPSFLGNLIHWKNN